MAIKTLDESGYSGRPYLHSDFRTNPVTLVWWAKSPTGRQSRFLHWVSIARTRIHSEIMKRDSQGSLCNVAVPTRNCFKTADEIALQACVDFPPPKLRSGYEWQGPFFNTEYDRNSIAPDEGQQGPILVMHRNPAPSENEGVRLRYVDQAGLRVSLQQAISS